MVGQNSYFVPGFGISRAVMQNDIHYYCGPDAIVRPYTYQGRDGFLVTTTGPALTQAQIDDLKISSREYEEKQSRIADESSVFVNKPIPVHHRGRRST
ncbi:hypothetical protein P280DRAFT_487626 [Massarina eburnea CBS 473.64]|uniref:Uncharacterized protein n=1 Tax=Massarina eburnea CBS 473.64 TaxID=1395130 RepID=A0A6A6S7D4_9PLEO|nr:hypothetical protein P280DRAFT_487626 [Massarina eburnea CBS 473.64]